MAPSKKVRNHHSCLKLILAGYLSTQAVGWIFAGAGKDTSITSLVSLFSKTLAWFLFFLWWYSLFCVFSPDTMISYGLYSPYMTNIWDFLVLGHIQNLIRLVFRCRSYAICFKIYRKIFSTDFWPFWVRFGCFRPFWAKNDIIRL